MTASSTLRLARVMLVGAVAVGLVSACSSGQITQTASQTGDVPGVNANVGPNNEILLRDLVVAYNGPQGYPTGGSAPLVVRIFNNGPKPITLTGASAPDTAASVALVDVGPVLTEVPTRTPAPAPAQTPASPSASPSASPATPPASPPAGSPSPGTTTPGTTTPGTTTPGTTTPAPQASFRLEIPAGSFLLLVPGQSQYLQLVGLRRPLSPGLSAQVTFAFEGIEPIDVTIPFGTPLTAAPRLPAEHVETVE